MERVCFDFSALISSSISIYYYPSMATEDTLAQARSRNEALHQSLKALMESNKVNEPDSFEKSDGNGTFFEEFKSNIEAIKKSSYAPRKTKEKDEESQKVAKSIQDPPRLAPPSEEPTRRQNTVRHQDMLLSKLERQSITIETLEAEIRKLRLQNQQLRETNHGLRAKAAQRPEPKTVAFQSAPAQAANVLPIHNKENETLRARAVEAENKVHRQQNTIEKLRTGLALVHHRYIEAKRKWDTSLSISAFQERVILDLKAKLAFTSTGNEDHQRTVDSTEHLLNGCEIGPEQAFESDYADTTQLILGYRSGPNGSTSGATDAYDHLARQDLGREPRVANKRILKKAALAALFVARVTRATQASRSMTEGQVWR